MKCTFVKNKNWCSNLTFQFPNFFPFKEFFIQGTLLVDLGVTGSTKFVCKIVFMCLLCIFFWGVSLAFISFKKDYMNSQKIQNYCFQYTPPPIQFSNQNTPFLGSLTKINSENRQRNLSETYQEGSRSKGVHLGFTSLLLRPSFRLTIIPKISFKRRQEKTSSVMF